MDQKRDELLFSSVKGRIRSRIGACGCVYQAIDINAIQKAVMRGGSTPTALMIAPGTKGFPADLNKRFPYDPEARKKLLAEAGYPQGFEVGLNAQRSLRQR